jgi:hypothetical protein
MLPAEAGKILREADRLRFLGEQAMVVGTNALIAYALEANGFIRDAPDETLDFDMALTGLEADEERPTLWKVLKEADMTYSVNTERPFQARNAKAYEVEILSAPSRIGGQIAQDRPRPIPLPEQEWLLNGRRVDRVVGVRDGEAARMVAPDPRWFALQKLWMAAKPERAPQKPGPQAGDCAARRLGRHAALPAGRGFLRNTARCLEAAFRALGSEQAATRLSGKTVGDAGKLDRHARYRNFRVAHAHDLFALCKDKWMIRSSAFRVLSSGANAGSPRNSLPV